MPNQQWENEISRNPAVELLQRMGYTFISPAECTQQRGSTYNVLLKDVLRGKLRQLNRYSYGGVENEFSAVNIERAITELEPSSTEGLVTASKKIFDSLLLGKSLPELVGAGKTQHFDFKYIDWKNPENNAFHVTQEFTVVSKDGQQSVRIDVVAFINGIPFVAIECKNPEVSQLMAVEQHLRNQKEGYVPHLYQFIQILLATNKNRICYATTNTSKEFWSEWKEEDESFLQTELQRLLPDRTPTPQDKTMVSLLTPKRAMEIIRFFILYDNNVKKICRYQQYFAVQSIIKTVEQKDTDGNRQGGVVWHTQGSGKSLTMVMLAKYLLTTIPGSPRVIVVTDRKELDRQITLTFSNTRLKATRAESGRMLSMLIEQQRADIITALINKFKTTEQMSVVSTTSDMFVLVDESHRTQNGLLATKMRTVFPNGCYIGFTGTPLMKSEKNTLATFGRLIHQYTIQDGVDDKAVVPLIYDGRFVEQKVDKENIDLWFEQTTRWLSDSQKNDLKRKWSALERLSSTSERIRRIALDIYQHYTSSLLGSGFNAMLATNYKRDAIRYLECFQSLGGLKCAVVISPPDMRENFDEEDEDYDIGDANVQRFWRQMMAQFQNADEYESVTKDNFCRGDIDILIVCSKLLTGFDAPRCHVLYIDKILKEHGLLQAIARTNRIHEGKDYGLIIDYRGLIHNLDDALEMYSGSGLDKFDARDLKGVAVDIAKAVPQLREAYSRIIDLLADVSDIHDQEAVEIFLQNDAVREKFYQFLCDFGKKLTTVLNSPRAYNSLPREECQMYQDAFVRFSKIRRSVKIRYCDAIDNSEYEPQMQKLLDTYMSVAGLKHITNPVNIFNKGDFENELNELGSARAKADAIVHSLNKSIHDKRDENPAYYDSFSKRIETVLEEYKNRVINDSDYLKKMRDILADFKEGRSNLQFPARIKHNVHAQAFFGVIGAIFESDMDQTVPVDLTAEFSEKIAEIIAQHSQIDWRNNVTIHNHIAQAIEDMFYDYEQETGFIIPLGVVDKIIENVETVALRRF